MQVCAGADNIYEDRGELQIAAEYIEPKAQEGCRLHSSN